jgi:hypothetical protein
MSRERRQANYTAGTFQITALSSTGACTTNSDQSCVSSRVTYMNNDRCSINVMISTTLTVVSWSTEAYFDHLDVNGVPYSGSSNPNKSSTPGRR